MHVPKLRQLTLSHNRVTLRGLQTDIGEVQSVLSACMQLEELYLSNNSITTIFSDWVLTLLNLRTLDLSHNLISSLTVSNHVIFQAVPCSAESIGHACYNSSHLVHSVGLGGATSACSLQFIAVHHHCFFLSLICT